MTVLVNIGVNHKNASLDTLDAVTLRNLEKFYNTLLGIRQVKGAVILQTCNRVEFFVEIEDGADVLEDIISSWSLETGFARETIDRLVETKEGDRVVGHLVRLSCGLESMLVGEGQILGQVRDAIAKARLIGAATPSLSDIFARTTFAAAKIRETTGLGKGMVSLGSAAVGLAEETLGQLRDKHALLIGTGRVGVLVAKALRTKHVDNIFVVGRDINHTRAFCRTYGGHPARLEELNTLLNSSDVAFVATSATRLLITKECLALNRTGTLVILDMSNPRNVSPDVQESPGVVLRTIDDLRPIGNESLSKQERVVEEAEQQVNQRVASIVAMFLRKRAEPIVSSVYRRADKIRLEEVAKALSKLKATPEQKEIFEKMSQSLVEKLLTPPMSNLRRAAEKGNAQTLQAARELFEAGAN